MKGFARQRIEKIVVSKPNCISEQPKACSTKLFWPTSETQSGETWNTNMFMSLVLVSGFNSVSGVIVAEIIHILLILAFCLHIDLTVMIMMITVLIIIIIIVTSSSLSSLLQSFEASTGSGRGRVRQRQRVAAPQRTSVGHIIIIFVILLPWSSDSPWSWWSWWSSWSSESSRSSWSSSGETRANFWRGGDICPTATSQEASG